jgi:hypothetical protein
MFRKTGPRRKFVCTFPAARSRLTKTFTKALESSVHWTLWNVSIWLKARMCSLTGQYRSTWTTRM